ncbi:MAG: 30S ribosomal protein S17 [Dehalococcoidia bacterium]|jgi:small subunit ribosomal protein S17|nr:30S ribosomal protein S17 [Dehalococcoidia bacterium]
MKETIKGRVVSDKMSKTVVVAVESTRRHPLYRKLMRRVRKFMAHDESGACHVGDVVEIVETRPLSARKRWRVVSREDAPVAGKASVVPDQGGEK